MAQRKRPKKQYVYEIPYGSGRWYLSRGIVDGVYQGRHRVDPFAPDFQKVYGNFLAGIPPRKPDKDPPATKIRDLQWALFQFYKSSPFITWKPARRNQKRGILDECAEQLRDEDHPEKGTYAKVPLDRFHKPFVLQRLVDAKVRANLYGAAVNRRKALRELWSWLHKNGHVKDNIALGLDKVRVPKPYQRRHTITDAEVKQYRDFYPYESKARLGFELGMAGARRSDKVLLGPEHLVLRNGVQYLEYYPVKGMHEDEPELAVVEVHEELAIAIATHVPTRKDRNGNPVPVVGHTTFLVSEKGRFQYDARNYGEHVFPKWVKAAGLPPRVTTHSLRRGHGRDLIHEGRTHEEVNVSQGRARGSRVVSVYVKDTDKRRIADLASARKRREQSK